MKTKSILLICLIWAIRVNATISTDKTLFVDYFGTTILGVNEDGSSGGTGMHPFERQQDLIEYATSHGFKTLILKRLDEAKYDYSSTTYKMFPETSTTLNFTYTATLTNNIPDNVYKRLADFIVECRTAGINHIAAADNPYYDPYDPNATPTPIPHSYVDNLFWDNIVQFNQHFNSVSGMSDAYFDMIYGEQDYWNTNNPVAHINDNFNNYYIPGLTYMKNKKGVSGSKISIVATYIGNMKKAATSSTTTNPTPIPVQDQADAIDLLIDWLYVEFYFDGNKINNPSPGDNPKQFMAYDDDRGKRFEAFASATTGEPTVVIPFFSSSAGVPGSNSGQIFFGDYLDYDHADNLGNPYFYNGSLPSNRHGTLDDITTIFEGEYTSADPYNLPAGNTTIQKYLSMEQLCETGGTVAHPYAITYPNKTSVNGEGTCWFKYSTMPDAKMYLKFNDDDVIGALGAGTVTVNADDLILTGTGTTVCNSGNSSTCNSLRRATQLGFDIKNYTWYYNGSVVNEGLSPSHSFTPSSTTAYSYITCEFEITSYTNSSLTTLAPGIYNDVRLRKTFKVDPFIIGLVDHFDVINYSNPTCPSYSNGTARVEWSPVNNVNYQYYVYCYFKSTNTTSVPNAIASSCNNYTVSGLTAGDYTVKLYTGFCYGSGSSITYSSLTAVVDAWGNQRTTTLKLTNSSALPKPIIQASGFGENCANNLSTASFSYYQWKKNGVNIPSLTYNGTSQTPNISGPYRNGSYTVTVTDAAGCLGTSAPYILKMDPTPIISGSNITCLEAGETNKIYTVTEDPNNATYYWTVPSGVTKTVDGNYMTINSWGSLIGVGGTISCTVTNACGNSATANFNVNGCCNNVTGDLNNATFSTTPANPLTGTFHINGTMNIINSGTCVTIDGANVSMNKEAKILVASGCTLKIINSAYLHACSNDMWAGIEIQGNGVVELNTKSKIEDAKIAINALSNGVIRIDDATLNANYEHVKINGNGGANASYIRNGAILTCTSGGIYSNCLKAPYTGLRTYRGVDLQNIGAISIGNIAGNRVEINFIDEGVFSQGCYTTVSYVNFSANGSGNFSQNGGTLASFENHFNDCMVGVKGTESSNMLVHNNNFQTCNKGVYIYRNKNSEFHIYLNTFNNCAGYGIQHVANTRCLHEIYSNVITYDREAYPFGIEVIGLIGEGDANAGSTTNIYNNELYNIPFGIHLQSMDDANIYSNLHNEVMSTPNSDYTSYGIKVENCNNTSIEGNSVSSYGNSLQQVWWSNGIMADNSPGTEMTCNSVGNIGRGLWIGGQSPNTKLAGNAMGNCYDQVYLNWNLMGLGDQGQDIINNPPDGLAFDNEWVGTVYSAGNGHQTNSYYSNYGKIGGYTIFHTRSGGVYEPTDNYVNDPSNYDICNTDVLYNFNGDTYCRERPELPMEREVEKRVALDNYNFDSYFETFNWMSKEYLLKQSKADATLAANDITIANAVLQIEQSNVGTINAIKDSISNTDSLSMAEILQLQQLNNGVQATKAVEANYKTANSLSLNFEKTGAFTNGQKNTIVYLSNLCPYAAGPAVYMARTLRALYDTIPHQYNSCSFYNPTPAYRKANGTNENSGIITTNLFPSPSNGNAIYEFAIDEKAVAQLKMFDFTGKLILSKDVSGTKKFEFKKLSLSEGVYRVQLFVNGELGDEQNMVVVK